jgi:hypothetical protein
MKNHKLYTVSDFIPDEEFIQWAYTGSNDRSGQAWFMQNPEKALIVAEAKEIVQSLTMTRKTQEASISSRFALAGKPKRPRLVRVFLL